MEGGRDPRRRRGDCIPCCHLCPVQRDLLWEQQAALTPSQPCILPWGSGASSGFSQQTQTPSPRALAGTVRLTSLSRNLQGSCRAPNPLLLLKGLCVGFPRE